MDDTPIGFVDFSHENLTQIIASVSARTKGFFIKEPFEDELDKYNFKTVVSLSSGGAEGMGRNLALMEMLTELGVPIHEVHGSSAGATVGAAYSMGDVYAGTETTHTDFQTTFGITRDRLANGIFQIANFISSPGLDV